MGYHREDCSVYDVHGNKKIKKQHYDLLEVQSRSRLNRQAQQDLTIEFIDYYQKLGDTHFSEEQINILKKLNNQLKKIIHKNTY
jgi:hypothetical protein